MSLHREVESRIVLSEGLGSWSWRGNSKEKQIQDYISSFENSVDKKKIVKSKIDKNIRMKKGTREECSKYLDFEHHQIYNSENRS